MQVAEIVRYPVKSLQGESVPSAQLEADGLRGDRGWGIRDETTGKILTGRRAPQLLQAAARLDGDGAPTITLPGGATCHGPGAETDAALSRWLGKPVRLVSAAETSEARAEFFEDATDDSSPAVAWTMPSGRFVDALPLLLLTTASLRTAAALYPDGDWRTRRFRPNVVLDVDAEGWVEDSWCGRSSVHIGTARLAPAQPCVRCTMVTRAQPDIAEDRDIFRTLARHHGATFGAWTVIAAAGRIAVGDAVRVEPLPSQA